MMDIAKADEIRAFPDTFPARQATVMQNIGLMPARNMGPSSSGVYFRKASIKTSARQAMPELTEPYAMIAGATVRGC